MDIRWLTTVDQHHENIDGSGYPLGLKGSEIIPEARLLRLVDSWCALRFQRGGRAQKTPREALRELHQQAIGQLDHSLFVQFRRLMGEYPPGTFVRLENRETAVVLRWGRPGCPPAHALRIFSAAGQPAAELIVRPLSTAGQRIRDYAELNPAQFHQIPWSRIWAGH